MPSSSRCKGPRGRGGHWIFVRPLGCAMKPGTEALFHTARAAAPTVVTPLMSDAASIGSRQYLTTRAIFSDRNADGPPRRGARSCPVMALSAFRELQRLWLMRFWSSIIAQQGIFQSLVRTPMSSTWLGSWSCARSAS